MAEYTFNPRTQANGWGSISIDQGGGPITIGACIDSLGMTLAAAPAMLEALNRIVHCCDAAAGSDRLAHAIENAKAAEKLAREAIAQAKGHNS